MVILTFLSAFLLKVLALDHANIGMRSCRLYSSVKLGITRKNPFANNENTSKRAEGIVPSPGQIIHPFYTPNKTEEFALCLREIKPSLLDGKPVIPALISDLQTTKPMLRNCTLKFGSVRGVNKWLMELSSIRRKSLQSEHTFIDDKMIYKLVKPSKLGKFNDPHITKLKELFGIEHSQQINPKTLDTMVDQFVNNPELGMFSEDIYLYLLQHHINSTDKIVAIIDSIKCRIHSDIDQFKVAETLALQILLSLTKNNLPLTNKFACSFESLLEEINDRFHIQSCETKFQAIVSQYFLDFFIETGNLNRSKKIYSHLVSNGLIPREKTTVAYLNLLDRTIGNSNKDILKKFAYISDFRTVIEKAQSPTLFHCLIQFCRHFNEVTSLLKIIQNAKNTKEVLDVTLLPLISKVGSLNTHRMVTSANLCSLYRMAAPFYDNKLPEKFIEAFILHFALQENYSMIATLLKGEKTPLSVSRLESILLSLEGSENKEGAVNLISCDEGHKRIFLENYLLPTYSQLSMKSRQMVLQYANTPNIFSRILQFELDRLNKGQKEIIIDVLNYGSQNNLLSEISSSILDHATVQSHLASMLKESGNNIEPLRKKITSKTNELSI